MSTLEHAGLVNTTAGSIPVPGIQTARVEQDGGVPVCGDGARQGGKDTCKRGRAAAVAAIVVPPRSVHVDDRGVSLVSARPRRGQARFGELPRKVLGQPVVQLPATAVAYRCCRTRCFSIPRVTTRVVAGGGSCQTALPTRLLHETAPAQAQWSGRLGSDREPLARQARQVSMTPPACCSSAGCAWSQQRGGRHRLQAQTEKQELGTAPRPGGRAAHAPSTIVLLDYFAQTSKTQRTHELEAAGRPSSCRKSKVC